MPKNHIPPKSYFQVPLCIFAFGTSPTNRLNTLIQFGCWHAGNAQWKRLSTAERNQHRELIKNSPNRPQCIDFERSRDVEAVLGGMLLNVTFKTVRGLRESISNFESFRDKFQQKFGMDCLVRLRTDLVFEARDRKGLSYEELAVYAAILSVIGRNRQPVRITQATIRRRAMGYRSARIAEQEGKDRMDQAKPLSEWRLRRTIQALQERGFFNRLTFGRRVTFYGIGQIPEGFQASIVRRLTQRGEARALRTQIDHGVTEEIRKLRAASQTVPAPLKPAEIQSPDAPSSPQTVPPLK